jgi:hypothetical protein
VVLFKCYARRAVYNRSRIDITDDNRYAKPCRSDRLEFAFLLKSYRKYRWPTGVRPNR